MNKVIIISRIVVDIKFQNIVVKLISKVSYGGNYETEDYGIQSNFIKLFFLIYRNPMTQRGVINEAEVLIRSIHTLTTQVETCFENGYNFLSIYSTKNSTGRQYETTLIV